MGSWHSPGLGFGQIWGDLWIFVFGMDMFWGIYIYILCCWGAFWDLHLFGSFSSLLVSGFFFFGTICFFFFSLNLAFHIHYGLLVP